MKKVGTYQLKTYELEFYRDHTDLAKDGRQIGRIGETWWAQTSGGSRQPENSPFDILELDGLRSEVRSAIKHVSFASSKEVGYGRSVTNEGYTKKLNQLDRFIIVNSSKLISHGYVDFWLITKNDLLVLGLGKNKKMKANKFWSLVEKGV